MKAYVYKWTHKPTYKWYIGFHVGNIDDNYVCSSKIVKPMIKSKPSEWVKEIIAFGESKDMFQLETEILQLFDAKNDPRSFNQHNNYFKNTTLGKKMSEETKDKIRQKRKLQVGNGMSGRKHTQESIEKMKKTLAEKYPNGRSKKNVVAGDPTLEDDFVALTLGA
jgi:hypothetical protein